MCRTIGAQLEQLTMTRTVRKSANHVSADQLSFSFANAPLLAPAETIAMSAPDLTIAEIVQPRPPRMRRPKLEPRRPAQVVPAEDRRLTVEETAEVLSVSAKTLEAWRRLGKGPAFVKLGRSVRYTMRALDAFTRERTVRNSAEGRMLDAQR